jgi:hypothetical protein
VFYFLAQESSILGSGRWLLAGSEKPEARSRGYEAYNPKYSG